MPIDLSKGYQQAHLCDRAYKRKNPDVIHTSRKLMLEKPGKPELMEEPRLKYVTERPYLPKNRRFKRFSTS